MPDNTDLEISRRSALAMLGSAGLSAAIGLPLMASDWQSDTLQKLLPQITDKSRVILAKILSTLYTGQIPASAASTLAEQENLSQDSLMLALIPLAQSFSRAPISNFHVGVVVRGESGALYTGANIEIPGQCLGFAVHAEQSALANAYMHGEHSVRTLAVGGAPCGHCRQFINEMSPDGSIMIITPQKPPFRLDVILPNAFGPAALGLDHGALPIAESNLTLFAPYDDLAVRSALGAARNSYAPYSKSPSGVAIRTGDGRVYRGSYIENVAFNPSLSPLQTALAAMIAGGEPYSAITGGVLVELRDATISQRPVTESVLKAIAPEAKLDVVLARAG